MAARMAELPSVAPPRFVVMLALLLVVASGVQAPAASTAAPDAATAERPARSIVVAADGSGDTATIGAAVEVATDGDTVLVRPGTYRESITLTRDIALLGNDADGPVIWVAPEEGPALRLRDSDAAVSGIRFRGPRAAVLVAGGAPTLERISFDGVALERGHNLFDMSLLLTGGTEATLRHATLRASGDIRVEGGARPLIEANSLFDGGGIVVEDAAPGTTIRMNLIEDARLHGIAVHAAGRPEITDNTIDNATSSGIAVGTAWSPGVDPLIRGNRIENTSIGVSVAQLANPDVVSNTLTDNHVGIFTAVSDATIRQNRVSGGGIGIAVARHAPRLSGNSIERNHIGLLVEFGSEPHLTGNLVCDNTADVVLTLGAVMPDRSLDRECT